MTALVLVGWEHCYIHNRHEPSLPGDYRACLECGHVYRTPWEVMLELLFLYRHWFNMGWDKFLQPIPPADEIYSCPLCTHDF